MDTNQQTATEQELSEYEHFLRRLRIVHILRILGRIPHGPSDVITLEPMQARYGGFVVGFLKFWLIELGLIEEVDGLTFKIIPPRPPWAASPGCDQDSSEGGTTDAE